MLSSPAIQTTSPLCWPGWLNRGTGSITVSRCRKRSVAVHGIRNKGRAIPSRDLATARERMRDWWRRVQS